MSNPDKIRKIKTMDGNTAAAHVAYAFSEAAAIYPITPSSPMAESMDEWASEGRKNIFGEEVKIIEMQSEGGAAGAVHGAVAAGSYTTTFTASQGLLLMIPNMYKIAAEQIPAVFHVAARAVSTHALSIFGDHSDVMGARQTGFVMLASNSVQQAMDLAAVAHLGAISGRLPVLHFFDGFRTSHENQKIEVWDYDDLKAMTDWEAVKRFRKSVFHPVNPYSMGSAEQPEAFFQHREAANTTYAEAADIIAEKMALINEKIGTSYKPFNYYGAPDAEEVIIAMGSVCEAAEEVADYLNAQDKKVGIIEVHLYRPFSVKYFIDAMPETVKKIAVMDRTKEAGGIGEPLYLDVISAIRDTEFAGIIVCRGRYGLGSKDTQPEDILAVYENLFSDSPKKEFTVSINDDVTGLSLKASHIPEVVPEGTISCKFWGLGADGTVGANKNSVKIIGDHTDKKVQAYFQYDSKKSGGVTISHLRFGDDKIRSTYYIKHADFVACHNPSYMKKYSMVSDVKPGGIFLLNSPWTDEELDRMISARDKKYIAENNINFYTCDAASIAREIGLGSTRTNTVLQSAFFKLSGVMPIEEAKEYMKDAIRKSYGKKGEKVVNMNIAAVDAGAENLHKVEIPESWKDAADAAEGSEFTGRDDFQTEYLNDILGPMARMEGDNIPVSAFTKTQNGMLPAGTAAFEKRGIAAEVPEWNPENCIQCGWCSMVCPHAAIRVFALNDEETEAYEKSYNGETLPLKKGKGRFAIGISALDCTGCGSCAEMCPARKKALNMRIADDDTTEAEQKKFNFLFNEVTEKRLPENVNNVKETQFRQPLLEFSGACPGCGESPYAKLVTQLFGDRMFIANATGCSSIWGCSAPSTPYTVNKAGRGPAWANSLFEDNAEFGLGMALSAKTGRNEMKSAAERLVPVIGKSASDWLEAMNDPDEAEAKGKIFADECEKIAGENADADFVINNRKYLIKPSMWIFGGDGWAYDIGYGGLDHVLASGENINVLVFDTEVYSNTGGQSSKSTPVGAVAKFAAGGKGVKKKDLAGIAMAYGYVYVAQIAMGANPEQTLKAIKEAEAYEGPSLIIAYAPCINHGIKSGMNRSMPEMKKAVRSGYWNLLRFNPELAKEGKNPLTIDSAAPSESLEDFLMGEDRYASLFIKNPERAKELMETAKIQAKEKYQSLVDRRDSLERN